jgi:AraC-like DNA-binding protein
MHFERQTIQVRPGDALAFRSILFSQTRNLALEGDEGRVRTDQVRLANSDIRFSRVRSTGHLISLVEDRDATFLFPRAGTAHVVIAGKEHGVEANDGVFLRPRARVTRVRPDGRADYEGHVLMLPLSMLDDLAAPDDRGLLPYLDVIRTRGPAARRLSACLSLLVSDSGRPADGMSKEQEDRAIHALLVDLVASWLAEHASPDTGERQRTTDRARVRRALEIMRERSDDPISVVDLAREVGLGVRNLQLAFQTVLGEGPRSRLARIRLERARERLLSAEAPGEVTAIALDSGFTHLSRFAGAYLKAFGERPSETLARRRRGAR